MNYGQRRTSQAQAIVQVWPKRGVDGNVRPSCGLSPSSGLLLPVKSDSGGKGTNLTLSLTRIRVKIIVWPMGSLSSQR